MLHSDKTGNIHWATWNLPIAVAKGIQVVRVFIQESAAPQASFVAFHLLWLVPRKLVIEEMDIWQARLSGGKSDIKKKDYSLSLLNVSQNQTCDKMRRMSGNRAAVIC